jgi:DNA-directed RNA polymerase subunit RPC12/RpoP
MALNEAPKLEEDWTDDIAGTDMKRHIMKHVCPNCDTDLELESRETWVRDCPECEYRWVATSE